MSRARVHEVSSPISLFPFIGILLCTMGALLVVLVAVSRSARDSAVRQVESQSQPAAGEANSGVQQKLDEVKRYVGSLNSVKSEAERKLRDEQLRLSGVEDHIRRLQEKMRSLQLAAKELVALEEEHYDDRDQAEREIERLHQLIAESQKTIASLREADANEARSYAVVPYEGPNGTFRRPIYIECLKDELVLQPEGVRITRDDLRQPIGTGNPLAAALRAARDHLLRLYPKEGQSRDTEPYPLLLVRADGLLMYDRARQAVEAGDFDLGFELVESDWKLKFPQPDPQLAGVEQQALEQALARQEVLAAAAPRAYRNPSYAVVGQFDYGDEHDSGTGGGGLRGRGPGSGGGSDPYASGGDGDSDVDEYGAGDGNSAGGTGSAAGFGNGTSSGGTAHGGSSTSGTNTSGGGGGIAGGAVQGGNAGTDAGLAPGGGDGGGDVGQYGTAGAGGGNGATSGSAGAAGGRAGQSGGGGAGDSSSGGSGVPAFAASDDPNSSPDAPDRSKNVSVMMGSSPPNPSDRASDTPPSISNRERMNQVDSRGQDWALRTKPPRSVPIRRTIHVIVRNDQIAILPDGATAANGPAPGKVVRIQGDTVQALDDFVKQIREQIDGWGIAGNGLYWRPVVVLNVGPEGQRRANDLARLLKNSRLEIRTDETARNMPQGTSHETR